MDRLLDKAFSKIHGKVGAVQQQYVEKQMKKAEQPAQAEEPPEQAKDAIKRILECWKNKEYFKCVLRGLPCKCRGACHACSRSCSCCALCGS